MNNTAVVASSASKMFREMAHDAGRRRKWRQLGTPTQAVSAGTQRVFVLSFTHAAYRRSLNISDAV